MFSAGFISALRGFQEKHYPSVQDRLRSCFATVASPGTTSGICTTWTSLFIFAYKELSKLSETLMWKQRDTAEASNLPHPCQRGRISCNTVCDAAAARGLSTSSFTAHSARGQCYHDLCGKLSSFAATTRVLDAKRLLIWSEEMGTLHVFPSSTPMSSPSSFRVIYFLRHTLAATRNFFELY